MDLKTGTVRGLVAVLASALGMGAAVAGAPAAGLPEKSGELFEMTKVWTVHVSFTAEQWAAMEPKGGGGFGGPGGPGGGGRGPGGPGRFSPSTFVAPAFMTEADENRDAKVSKEELTALGEKWFGEWDKAKAGTLSGDQLRDGLNGTFAMPGPGGPPPRGPGAPGGGRGPRSFLQGPEGKRNGLASAMGIEFEYVRADLEFAGAAFKDVAVRYKGNGTFLQSRGSEKRSLKIDLNKHVDGQDIAGVNTLNLHSNVTDASWMNEVLSHRLFRDAGVPAPRTAYARVYVTVPGKHERAYLGLYSLVEDVDKDFAEDRFDTKKGAIFKPVTPALFAHLGDEWDPYKQIYDPKTNVSDKEKKRVIEFARLVSSGSDEEFAAKLDEYVDLDNFSRFMAVTVCVCTLDSILGPGQNYYVHLHPKTDKFQFIPWDMDHSFGQFYLFGTQEQRERLSIHRPWQGENRFLERVFKVEAFKKQYLARLEELGATVFRPERFEQQVDEIAAAIREAVKEESAAKLERFEKVVAGEAVPPVGFGGPGAGGEGRGGGAGGPGGGGPGFMPFMQPVKPIKAFVRPRAQAVADQLAGRSEGERVGGFGFGGPGGGRGPGGGPGGAGRAPFGPGNFMGPAFMGVLDEDKDARLTREEVTKGFAAWFVAWDGDGGGEVTEEELRAGLDKVLAPRGGPGAQPRP